MDKNVSEYFSKALNDMGLEVWAKKRELEDANKEKEPVITIAADIICVASELLDQAAALIKPEDDEQND